MNEASGGARAVVLRWIFWCCLLVLLGFARGLPKSPQEQGDDSFASISNPNPPASLARCLHPDCRGDCGDCEPAEIVAALSASIAGDPAVSWVVQLNGVEALANLMDTPTAAANRAVVASMGGIEILLQATDEALAVQPKTDLATPLGTAEQIPQLLTRLVTVLGSLSVDNSHNQESIAASGGIAKIARAMSVGHHRYKDPELVSQSCWALAQLARNNLKNPKIIVGAKGVEFAERAIQLREGRTSHCRTLVDYCRYAAKGRIAKGRSGKLSLIHASGGSEL